MINTEKIVKEIFYRYGKCIQEIIMPLLISYQDTPNKIVYANLFSATNKIKAFNPNLNSFDTISLSTQSDFALTMEEEDIRKGYYSHTINDTSNIPETENGDFYLVEVFEALGSGHDRESDVLLGTMAFYWNGEQEVDICGCQTQAGSSLTVQDIWEYEDRSLTESVDCGETGGSDISLECPDPYITVNTTINGLEDLSNQLNNTDTKVDQIINLINNLSIAQPINFWSSWLFWRSKQYTSKIKCHLIFNQLQIIEVLLSKISHLHYFCVLQLLRGRRQILLLYKLKY